jgi:hypothetical protein
MVCGYNRASGIWRYTVVNQSTENFSDMTVAFEDRSDACDVHEPGDVDDGMYTGRMPAAISVGFTSKDGKRHQIHLTIPPPQPPHDRKYYQYPDICLMIESRDKIIATYKDPLLNSLRRWSFRVENDATESFLHVAATFEGKSYPLANNVPSFSPYNAPVGTGVLGPKLPTALDVIMTSEDGTQHRVHVVTPPLTRLESAPPCLYLTIKSRDKVVAGYVSPFSQDQPHWWYAIENRSGEEISDVAVDARVDDSGLLPDFLPDYILSGHIWMFVARPWDDNDNKRPMPIPKTMNVSFTSKDGKWHMVHVAIPAAARRSPDGVSPEVHLIIEGRDRVVATDIDPGTSRR